MKINTRIFYCLLIVLGLSGFTSEGQLKLINNSNTPLNEVIFKRLLLKNLQPKINGHEIIVTVVSYSKNSEESALRTNDADSKLMTKRINYQCNLQLTIGDKEETINKSDVWVGRLFGAGLNPPTDEQLIVDLVTNHLNEGWKSDKK